MEEKSPSLTLFLRLAQFLLFTFSVACMGQCQTPNYYQVQATACGTGYDIGALIKACLSSGMIPTAHDGLQVGTILLPNTSVPLTKGGSPPNWVWATPVVLGPGVSLVGQGLLASYFECTVSAGDCLTYDATQTSGPYTRTSNPASVWQGFTLTGYTPLGWSEPLYKGTIYPLNLFHFKDARGLTVRDVAADGATGACFLFENVNHWTERNLFENVSSMYNCPIGWRFKTSSSYNSFGYNRFLDIRLNLYGSQTGFSFENNGNMYNSTLRATINKCSTSSGTATKVIHMQDTAQITSSELHVYAEDSCGSIPGGNFLDITSSSNVLTYFGELNPSPYTDQNNNIARGAVVKSGQDVSSLPKSQ